MMRPLYAAFFALMTFYFPAVAHGNMIEIPAAQSCAKDYGQDTPQYHACLSVRGTTYSPAQKNTPGASDSGWASGVTTVMSQDAQVYAIAAVSFVLALIPFAGWGGLLLTGLVSYAAALLAALIGGPATGPVVTAILFFCGSAMMAAAQIVRALKRGTT